jgi:hypothetical protein
MWKFERYLLICARKVEILPVKKQSLRGRPSFLDQIRNLSKVTKIAEKVNHVLANFTPMTILLVASVGIY